MGVRKSTKALLLFLYESNGGVVDVLCSFASREDKSILLGDLQSHSVAINGVS